MNALEELTIKLLTPRLFNSSTVHEYRKPTAVVRGIKLAMIRDYCKGNEERLLYVLRLLERQLSPLNFKLQVYQHREIHYLTAVSLLKLPTGMNDSHAAILGLFHILRDNKCEPVAWNTVESELAKTPLKITNPRKLLDFLVLNGLLYICSANPLVVDYGPLFFLEFSKEGIEEFAAKIRSILSLHSFEDPS